MKRTTIASEITGKVWKIEAAAGSKLAEDDPIVILESMKMEIPVVAPRAGTVAEVLVDDSEPVEFGQVLLVIQ